MYVCVCIPTDFLFLNLENGQYNKLLWYIFGLRFKDKNKIHFRLYKLKKQGSGKCHNDVIKLRLKGRDKRRSEKETPKMG